EGQYLALGDNSGLSHDSRLWGSETVPHYVDRKYLIGKAFFVYWPHGIPIPGTRVPLIPNVGKMRHID
ncbi:MAG: S26 family signal peptidase, partial [Thermoguttaceae bacterium]|nr:S26 family signal peptidase [Thermoguttaceae bacterium]